MRRDERLSLHADQGLTYHPYESPIRSHPKHLLLLLGLPFWASQSTGILSNLCPPLLYTVLLQHGLLRLLTV